MHGATSDPPVGHHVWSHMTQYTRQYTMQYKAVHVSILLQSAAGTACMRQVSERHMKTA